MLNEVFLVESNEELLLNIVHNERLVILIHTLVGIPYEVRNNFLELLVP